LAIEHRSTEIHTLRVSGGNVMLVIFAAPAFGWGVVLTVRELGHLSRAGIQLGIDIHRDPDVDGPQDDDIPP
jgi:hypothetical protein